MHAGYVAICSHLFAFLFRPWRDKPCPAALWEIYMAEIRHRQDKESQGLQRKCQRDLALTSAVPRSTIKAQQEVSDNPRPHHGL